MIGDESIWLKHDTVRRLHCQQHTVNSVETLVFSTFLFFRNCSSCFVQKCTRFRTNHEVRATDEVTHVNIMEVWSRLATHRKIYSNMWLNYFLGGHAMRLAKPTSLLLPHAEIFPPRPTLFSKMCTIDWVIISNIEQGRGEIFQHK